MKGEERRGERRSETEDEKKLNGTEILWEKSVLCYKARKGGQGDRFV